MCTREDMDLGGRGRGGGIWIWDGEADGREYGSISSKTVDSVKESSLNVLLNEISYMSCAQHL